VYFTCHCYGASSPLFRAQIGPSLTEQTTQTFMTLLTREHLEETLLQEGSLGSRVVER